VTEFYSEYGFCGAASRACSAIAGQYGDRATYSFRFADDPEHFGVRASAINQVILGR
jgi:hypothetical protein